MNLLNLERTTEDNEFVKGLYSWQAAEGPASKCIQCGTCEAMCPQSIDIIDHLVEAVEHFEGYGERRSVPNTKGAGGQPPALGGSAIGATEKILHQVREALTASFRLRLAGAEARLRVVTSPHPQTLPEWECSLSPARW